MNNLSCCRRARTHVRTRRLNNIDVDDVGHENLTDLTNCFGNQCNAFVMQALLRLRLLRNLLLEELKPARRWDSLLLFAASDHPHMSLVFILSMSSRFS